MRTVELFAGTGSFSKVAKQNGYMTFTIDNNPTFKTDLCCDILNLYEGSWQPIFILWASPPCTAFSVAAINKNWDKDTKLPKSNNALVGIQLLEKTIRLINATKPTYWFIENPRGMMRVIIDSLFKKYSINDYKRYTVTYCQYGDTRMKPTDIWTNFKEWQPKPPCKNGAKCHTAAPRGSRTGTQGIKSAKDRAIIPPALFKDIFDQIERG